MRWRFLLLSSILWALMACAAPPVSPPTGTAVATATAQLPEELARALAIAAVSQSGPEMNAPLEAPRVTMSAQITWAQARERYGDALPELPSLAPATAVWVVELSGAWEGGMDAPGLVTVLARYRTARVVLDATTGQSVTTSYQP